MYRLVWMWVLMVGGAGILISGDWIGLPFLLIGLVMLARSLSHTSARRG